VGTLEAMAKSGIEYLSQENILYCPMIDARRMEVFTAIYDKHLTPRLEPVALILEEELFKDFFDHGSIMFFGSGSIKYKLIQQSRGAIFSNVSYSAEHVGKLADEAFKASNFANLSYSQPTYLKEFYSVKK
jgi:tRNA threonylcarbamoyladenosine biosynthesis protein TsaB